jgi:hypothetical protein
MTKETLTTFWVVQRIGSPIQFVTYAMGLTEDVMSARKYNTPEEAREWSDFAEGDLNSCRVRKVTVTTKVEVE